MSGTCSSDIDWPVSMEPIGIAATGQERALREASGGVGQASLAPSRLGATDAEVAVVGRLQHDAQDFLELQRDGLGLVGPVSVHDPARQDAALVGAWREPRWCQRPEAGRDAIGVHLVEIQEGGAR
jgi:hypothetical protein